MQPDRKIKVLIVDDSAIVRKVLTEAVSSEDDLMVVGTASDPYVARDKILSLKPDVLTLDIEMPRMDGLTFLEKLMRHHPMPVVVISSLGQSSSHATLDALRLGAVEVLAKPGDSYSVGELRNALAQRIRAAACARLSPVAGPAPSAPEPLRICAPRTFPPGTVIAIGASTGGTEAIHSLLSRLPPNSPGVLIAQHIPASFSATFAQRLNQISPLEVREARDGDSLSPGYGLVAPGDLHMVLQRSQSGYSVRVKKGPPVCYQRPSVDVLFSSVAEAAGPLGTGVLLTGMGADGARGLLRMRQAGARTIAQDEESCVVFGMPKEAIRLGAADRVLPLSQIPDAIAGS